MKKLIKLDFNNTTRERKTEDSYSELYSYDKNNGSFEFEILNDTLTTEQVIALFKFTESNKIWKTTGTIEGNKVKVTFDTSLITQNETVICYLYFDEEQRTSDTFRFKFKVKVSEIDKMNRYEVKERFINNTVIVDRLDVVTKEELKEALKNVGGIATEGLLTEVKAEELYAKKSEAVDNTNFELVKNRVLALELKTDKDTVYDDSELKGRISVLEAREDNNTIYDDTNVRERLTALESKPNVDVNNLVTKDELASKNYLTEHQDTSNFALKSEIPQQYNDTEVKERLTTLENKPPVDLSNYATKEELRSVSGSQPLGDNLVTKEELEAKHYISDVSNLATKEELQEVRNNQPTVDTSHFVTRDELEEKHYLTEMFLNNSTLAQRVSLIEEQPDKDTVYDDTPLKERVTALESKAIEGGAYDDKPIRDRLDVLEAKHDNDTIYDDTEVKRRLTELESKPAVDTSVFVTDEKLNEKGYLTQHQDLSPYALKSEIPQPYNDSPLTERVTALESRPITGGSVDTSNLVTKEELAPIYESVNYNPLYKVYTEDTLREHLDSEESFKTDNLDGRGGTIYSNSSHTTVDIFKGDVNKEKFVDFQTAMFTLANSIPDNYKITNLLYSGTDANKVTFLSNKNFSDVVPKEELKAIIKEFGGTESTGNNIDTPSLATKEELAKTVTKEELEAKHYVTEEELNNKAYLTQQNLDNYALKSELPTPYNDSLLNERVTALESKAIEGGAYDDTDLRNRVINLENKPPLDTSEFVTNQALESRGYINDVSNFVTKEELTNKGYLTTHQSLDNVVTKEELATKGYITDVSNLVTKEELESKNYLTTPYNDAPLKERVEVLENKVDKDTVYNDTELRNRVEVLENKPNVDLSNYVTNEQLENKGFIKQHQELSHLATTSDLEALRNIAVSKSELSKKLDTTEFNSFKDSVVTKSELAEKGYLTETTASETYAKKSELPTPYNDSALVSRVSALESKTNTNQTLPANQYEIHGTGMPNGVVEAEIGTTYVDKNKTNGALKWIKTTDGGNQGWEVLIGDTGWRTLNSVSRVGNSFIKIRRVNNLVTYQFGGLQWGWFGVGRRNGPGFAKHNSSGDKGAKVVNPGGIPVGFRSETSLVGGTYDDKGRPYGIWYLGGVNDSNFIQFTFNDPIPTDRDIGDIRVSAISYLTNEPWPVQLP